MPILTAIKSQKNKKRVNVYIDNKFGFGLHLETLIKRRLKVDQELTEEEIAEIVKESEFQTTYDKILRFASLRPRSEKEFNTWLKKYKVHESLHSELFKRLKRLDFIDDKKFSVWWVEQRQSFRPKSKRVLNQELRNKGVNQEIIKEVLENENIDETAAVKKVLSKKMYRWNKLQGIEKKKKIYNFLAQRGFGSDVIREVMEDFNGD